MNRLARKASGCNREGITRDDPGRHQFMCGILDIDSIREVIPQSPSGSQLGFFGGDFLRTWGATRFWGLAISIAFVRFELVFLGGHPPEIGGSHLPSFIKVLPGSFNGM